MIFFPALISVSISFPTAPSTRGTLILLINFLACILLPIRAMTLLVGPIKVIPASSQALTKSGFSARNPYPGWMASQLALCATEMIFPIFRYVSLKTSLPIQ